MRCRRCWTKSQPSSKRFVYALLLLLPLSFFCRPPHPPPPPPPPPLRHARPNLAHLTTLVRVCVSSSLAPCRGSVSLQVFRLPCDHLHANTWMQASICTHIQYLSSINPSISVCTEWTNVAGARLQEAGGRERKQATRGSADARPTAQVRHFCFVHIVSRRYFFWR